MVSSRMMFTNKIRGVFYSYCCYGRFIQCVQAKEVCRKWKSFFLCHGLKPRRIGVEKLINHHASLWFHFDSIHCLCFTWSPNNQSTAPITPLLLSHNSYSVFIWLSNGTFACRFINPSHHPLRRYSHHHFASPSYADSTHLQGLKPSCRLLGKVSLTRREKDSRLDRSP